MGKNKQIQTTLRTCNINDIHHLLRDTCYISVTMYQIYFLYLFKVKCPHLCLNCHAQLLNNLGTNLIGSIDKLFLLIKKGAEALKTNISVGQMPYSLVVL